MAAKSGTSYKKALRRLQEQLVVVQRSVIQQGDRVLVLVEGRDAAGKDGTIKRITAHMSPRDTRVVALGKPSDREQHQWYFQRFVHYLPASGEFVLFNRSWYNRAGVEHVLGFCSDEQYRDFIRSVVEFERMLVESGIQIIKYYLDISRDEQKKRLRKRVRDPLKQWKVSPVDEVALQNWDQYTKARDVMLKRTHHPHAPWVVVRADDKHTTRLEVLRDLLQRVECPERCDGEFAPDRDIVFEYAPEYLERLAR